ncbi:unnamed protein product [Orchesella dallaii]|uniref:Uncharacterized protein n=1 Tax=Orchesella dallaii TaxID=48710 RepID=A0ABP1REF8_9HEXA
MCNVGDRQEEGQCRSRSCGVSSSSRIVELLVASAVVLLDPQVLPKPDVNPVVVVNLVSPCVRSGEVVYAPPTPYIYNIHCVTVVREIPGGFDRAIQKITKFEHQESIDDLKRLPEKLSTVIKAVRENIQKAQKCHEKHQNKKRREHKFQSGDLVMIKTHEQSKKAAKIIQKMIQRYKGPYKLGEQVNDVTFEILTVPKDESIGHRHVEELTMFRKRKGCEIVSPECMIDGKVVRKKPRSN